MFRDKRKKEDIIDLISETVRFATSEFETDFNFQIGIIPVGKKVAEINDMYPILIFDGEESLTVECSWRLRNEKTILVGSIEYKSQETHQKAKEKLSNLLLGQKIKDITITSALSDLKIQFCNGDLFELFTDSSIYESWTLSDGKDFMLIAFRWETLYIFKID